MPMPMGAERVLEVEMSERRDGPKRERTEVIKKCGDDERIKRTAVRLVDDTEDASGESESERDVVNGISPRTFDRVLINKLLNGHRRL